MKPIIEVKGLSKKYRLGEIQPYYTLRDSLAGVFKNPFAAVKSQLSKDEFWALKDINFEVNQGEVVGIIGRNGAGKSTLLKILSQITPPTEGEVILRGRVGSLLEVGTGFSPELTGRENIYLNGAVLGMKKSEVKKKFDEIVAFSEVEKFLDTPLKHYSSGMYMRLAFAVAAHLEPEILIVDEVLAVGDTEFQKKCIGKMGEVAGEGRTVLFVSHNMGAIRNLCKTSYLLNDGKLIGSGKTDDVIQKYINTNQHNRSKSKYNQNDKKSGDHLAKIISASILDKNNKPKPDYLITEEVKVTMEIKVVGDNSRVFIPNFHFTRPDGEYIFISNPSNQEISKSGKYNVTCTIPPNFLNSGSYYVGLALTSYPGTYIHFFLPNELEFEIVDPITNVPTRSYYMGEYPGVVRPLLDWEIERIK
jgi:lipopolysaccharide transport system ATP-binding protein